MIRGVHVLRRHMLTGRTRRRIHDDKRILLLQILHPRRNGLGRQEQLWPLLHVLVHLGCYLRNRVRCRADLAKTAQMRFSDRGDSPIHILDWRLMSGQRQPNAGQCGNPIKSQQSAPTSISLSDTIVDTAPAETSGPDLGATQPLSAVVPPTPAPVLPKSTDHSVRGRVEHIRKVSSVVIDQAAYDPSLRFLLVAAAFFILFLVLLIMSKVIG